MESWKCAHEDNKCVLSLVAYAINEAMKEDASSSEKPMGKRLHRWVIIRQDGVQFSSVTQSSVTLCNPMDCSTPGLLVHYQLPEIAQIHVHQVSDAIQPSHPLSSPSPPAFNLSQHEFFSNESVLHMRWPKCWSFDLSISPSSEYSGLISFRMDCYPTSVFKKTCTIFFPLQISLNKEENHSLSSQKSERR